MNSCVSTYTDKSLISTTSNKFLEIDFSKFIGRKIDDIFLEDTLKNPIRINCNRLNGGPSLESVTIIYNKGNHIVLYPVNHLLDVGKDSQGPLSFEKIKMEKIKFIRVFFNNRETFYSNEKVIRY